MPVIIREILPTASANSASRFLMCSLGVRQCPAMLRATRHSEPSLGVVPVPGKGRGVVAARRFLRGELVDATPV